MRNDLAAKGASSPLLSILLPVYNVAPYLEECVRSIISQVDRSDIEIILLDDASTDGSYAVCEQLKERYGPAISLLRHGENAGVSAARNGLIDAAQGAYIWFVDPDDYMLPGSITALRSILDSASPDMILCDYLQNGLATPGFIGQANGLGTDIERLISGVFEARKLHLWSKITRRSLWSHMHKFPEGRCFEDIATVPWLLLNTESYYYTPQPWIFYRVRAGSIVNLASHKTAIFDDRKNDDLAMALHGYPEALASALPNMGLPTRLVIGQFLSKEYTKIVHRLIKNRWRHDTWPVILIKLNRYHDMMQLGSPMPFRDAAHGYLRQGKIVRWLITLLCLYLGSLRGTQKRLPQ